MTEPQYVPGHALLAGKTVVVTAAAGSGIGSAVAQRCIEEGARVVISDKHERRLGETAERLGVTGVPCDVTNEDSVQALFAAASEELGAIDVLVNNAGLGGSAELHEMTDEQWNVVLDVTLNGTMRCTRAALNHMYANGRGVIVNNASVVGWRAQAEQAHYAAAKAGLNALTRAAARDVARYGIRVNAVAPSLVVHPFLLRVSSEEVIEAQRQQEAFKRSAEAWEVANVMVFLASDYASYLTGEVVPVSYMRP